MERPLWNRIQELYHLTLPMPWSERNAYLAGACDNDQLLMREVASLLRAHDAADGFLESPIFELGLKVISSNNQNGKSTPVADSDESLAGTTIEGRYLVETKLGHGGIGKVYLARDLKLHQRCVVIKVLLEASLDDPYVVTKFRQEVEALSRIDHPNVVSVLGEGKLHDGKPYIVMQYVDGVTLRSQIPGEGMDLERAASILKQIGAALEHVHERCIFHRDLKPENILLQSLKGGTEWVKVVDFGIAKVKDSVIAPSTVNKVSVGTVLYMSPEQLRGGEAITAASDIYSMAVIAYEMITGRRPFNPSSAPQLLEMHREGVRLNPIDLRPNLSAEARAILLRALSFDPAARYQSAAEFGDQLARALMDRKPAPIPNPPGQVVPQRPARLPRYLIGALLIILVSIGMAIYLNKGGPKTTGLTGNQLVADPQPSPPTRTFNYWLDVQKIRSGKPFGKAFLSSGRDIFETGYKFRLNVSSPDPAFVYVFNEGPPTPSGTSFTLVYPTPSTNRGGTLGPSQLVKTNWNTFAGETGTENFWIVWSTSPVPELEAVKTEAFKHAEGGLTGETVLATKKFLEMKQAGVKTRYTTDNELQQTTVRGNGNLLVKLVEFQHR
jgi:serine/threonine protein kinase